MKEKILRLCCLILGCIGLFIMVYDVISYNLQPELYEQTVIANLLQLFAQWGFAEPLGILVWISPLLLLWYGLRSPSVHTKSKEFSSNFHQ